MSDQTIFADTRNAISSPGSEGGLTRYGLPDGPTIGPSGPEAAPASRFRSRENDPASMMRDISGLSGETSSKSADLQERLASKLQPLLNGSELFTVIWKKWATPWGPSLSRPRARGLRIDVTGTGSLPTPSGTSNHGKNHVAGRIDEWGGSSNYFRGTEVGPLHLPGFELWTMGYPDAWRQLMPPAMRSSRKPRKPSSKRISPSKATVFD